MLGEYVVDREIARGGLGRVLLAHHTSGALPPSAIKVGGLVGDKERLQVEYDRLSKLKHPGIVRAREIGIQDGAPYLVTDYVEGICLNTWLREHRPSWQQTALLVASVGDAPAYVKQRVCDQDSLAPSLPRQELSGGISGTSFARIAAGTPAGSMPDSPAKQAVCRPSAGAADFWTVCPEVQPILDSA